jgi:hypothetical protein
MIERITQSFMKAMREYLNGEGCGNLLKASWVDDRILENEEPGQMEIGSYYEFVAFGTLPKSGKVQPLYKKASIAKNGNSTNGLGPNDMLKPYRLAHVRGTRLRALLLKMGLEVVVTNKRSVKGRFEGTIDLVCRVTRTIKFDGIKFEPGQLIVIDLKFSGLLGDKVNKKNKHGWQWTREQKEYHGTQAKQYSFLESLPFFFLVESSGDDEHIEMFHTPVTQDMIDSHISEGNYLMDRFKFWVSAEMLIARPSLKKCSSCPLKDECKDRQEIPVPKLIDLNY